MANPTASPLARRPIAPPAAPGANTLVMHVVKPVEVAESTELIPAAHQSIAVPLPARTCCGEDLPFGRAHYCRATGQRPRKGTRRAPSPALMEERWKDRTLAGFAVAAVAGIAAFVLIVAQVIHG